MSKLGDQSREAHSGFYLTLVSIMQSLALGYLLQLLGDQLLARGALPLNMVFQAVTALLAIILVWHQYAIGTIVYRWKLDIFDSIIPYLLGICEYSMIAAIGIPEAKTALSEVRFSLWLWSLAAFAFVSVFAYWNQFGKADCEPESRTPISMSRRSMLFTIGYVGMFSLLAYGCSAWHLPHRFHWIVSLFVSLAFLVELVRVERAYASIRR